MYDQRGLEFVCFLFFWAINMFVVYKGIESIRFLLNIKAPLLIALGLLLLAWAYRNAGGFGFYSNEIAATSNATLAGLRTKGLLISVDTPLWTQCAPASQIADAELNGTDNPMSKRFGIVGTGQHRDQSRIAFRLRSRHVHFRRNAHA